jgi:Smg protein
MKENMLDVLMYLFENCIDEDYVSSNQDILKSRLVEAGFAQSEINKAFNWLEDLADQRDCQGTAASQHQHSIRIFSPREEKKIDASCRGLLIYLEQLQVITPATRELVIERALALEADDIDLEKFRWIILMVMFNLPEQENAGGWLEDLVLETLPAQLH